MTGPAHEDFRRVRSPFEGALVRLRAIEEEDLEKLHELFWDPEVTRFLSAVWPESTHGTREWWERMRGGSDQAVFAVETTAGHFLGGAGLHEISASSRTAMLGIWLAREHWGQGFGTDAVRTLCRFGFGEMNLRRITLHVYANNPRGIRAYQKVGFVEEGRLRQDHFVDGGYVDTVVMGLLAWELAESSAPSA
jgi:RimJ/RimL family protein N-acetyltransferase